MMCYNPAMAFQGELSIPKNGLMLPKESVDHYLLCPARQLKHEMADYVESCGILVPALLLH